MYELRDGQNGHIADYCDDHAQGALMEWRDEYERPKDGQSA